MNELSDSISKNTIINFSKPALFSKIEGTKIRCELCPHVCLIGEGKYGICKTRINRNGKLFSIAYGNLCTRYIDPIEKKPLYHFLPASKAYSIAIAGCNLSCLNCQNWSISQIGPNENEIAKFIPAEIVADCIKNKCKSIAYTYTEPVCSYEFVLETSVLAKEQGIKNVLISNGFINEKPLNEIAPYLNAANIDLKAFDDDIYRKLCGASLNPVLNTLLNLKEKKVWLEITYLIVPGLTDDLEMIKKMCDWLFENNLDDCPLHFSKFYPTYKLKNVPVTSLNILENAVTIAQNSGIKYTYIGNIPEHESENTFCPSCKKKIIERCIYKVSQIQIIDGKCKFCNTEISGVWN